MCGRYKLTTDRKRLKEAFLWLDENEYFDIHGPVEQSEIFPGTQILGFNNKWQPEEDLWTICDKTWDGKWVSAINARSESIVSVPMFRDAFQTDRVLIPATALFEWQEQPDGSKKKFEIWFDEPVFAFAGVARDCEIKGVDTRCTVIITTRPNEIFEEIHNTKKRQAVVIRREDHEKWLDPKTSVDELQKLMQPLPSAETHFKEADPTPSQEQTLFEK